MSKLDNLKKAKQIVASLAKGENPYTKEQLGFEQIVVQDERVVQWLCFVEEELGNIILKQEKNDLSK